MKVPVHTKRYINCPNCGESEQQVEALFSRTPINFGPWDCERCDHTYRGSIDADGVITITEIKPIDEPLVYHLLRFRDLYVVAGPYRDQTPKQVDYLIHSHQCPVSIMAATQDVFSSTGENDPHGIFRYIATAPASKVTEDGLNRISTLDKLYAFFNTDGAEPSTEWPEANGGMLPLFAELSRIKA